MLGTPAGALLESNWCAFRERAARPRRLRLLVLGGAGDRAVAGVAIRARRASPVLVKSPNDGRPGQDVGGVVSGRNIRLRLVSSGDVRAWRH